MDKRIPDGRRSSRLVGISRPIRSRSGTSRDDGVRIQAQTFARPSPPASWNTYSNTTSESSFLLWNVHARRAGDSRERSPVVLDSDRQTITGMRSGGMISTTNSEGTEPTRPLRPQRYAPLNRLRQPWHDRTKQQTSLERPELASLMAVRAIHLPRYGGLSQNGFGA